jgi:hypothetical protein
MPQQGQTADTLCDSSELPQRLASSHCDGQSQVEAAAAALHRNDETDVRRIMHAPRHASRFAAEKQDVILAEGKIRVGQGGLGREKDQASTFGAAPAIERRKLHMPAQDGDFQIIHAGAFQRTIGEIEARRLDDIDGKAQAGAKAKDRAGVARYVRLIKRDSDSRRQLITPSNCGRAATPSPGAGENFFWRMAFSGEWRYRARVVNSNRRRQAWVTYCSLLQPARLVGARPEGGFGSTFSLTIQSFIDSIPAGAFSRPSSKESSDVCSCVQGAFRPA